MSSSADTVSAAATAIFTSERRAQPSTVQKKRWTSFRNFSSCFGSHKHTKRRISHAVHVSEPSPQAPVHLSAGSSAPFIVPPSSPASFLQSDPPSAAHTPVGRGPDHPYSPTEARPIYTIGPYAYETQLVSPPVFSSTFTTEPSTAPFTPTTPSSPEVPFAHLLPTSYEFIGYEHFSNYDDDDVASLDRVSFELVGEDIPICVVKETTTDVPSSKDFDFDNSKEEEEVSDKSSIDCEWWTSDEAVVVSHRNKWTFFRVLQLGVV